VEVSAGIYAADPSVLELVPRDVASTMPELAERAISDGRLVTTWRLRHDWMDVGTPQDLISARGGS
jgi:NDP-sugar pyrophosphorylase family protein